MGQKETIDQSQADEPSLPPHISLRRGMEPGKEGWEEERMVTNLMSLSCVPIRFPHPDGTPSGKT